MPSGREKLNTPNFGCRNVEKLAGQYGMVHNVVSYPLVK